MERRTGGEEDDPGEDPHTCTHAKRTPTHTHTDTPARMPACRHTCSRFTAKGFAMGSWAVGGFFKRKYIVAESCVLQQTATFRPSHNTSKTPHQHLEYLSLVKDTSGPQMGVRADGTLANAEDLHCCRKMRYDMVTVLPVGSVTLSLLDRAMYCCKKLRFATNCNFWGSALHDWFPLVPHMRA